MLNKLVKLIIITSSLLFGSYVNAQEDYPNKPIAFVVGFGTGGGADRLARAMSGHFSKAIGQPVNVINRPGAITQIANTYLLNQRHDGYHILVSTPAPYLTNSILRGNASYSLDDFAMLNLQWYEYELIAVNKDTPYQTLDELLDAIEQNPKKVRASVVEGSGGQLIINMLLNEAGIPTDNLNLVTYSSGGKSRTAVAGGQVDFISTSAKAAESIREFIRPLAVVLKERNSSWDAPTINEALESRGIEVPVLYGSIRGFYVTKEFKNNYPDRFNKLADTMESVLKDPAVQAELNKGQIGHTWTGPEESDAIMLRNMEQFRQYSGLLR